VDPKGTDLLKALRALIIVSATFSVLYILMCGYFTVLSYYDAWPNWMKAEIMFQGVWYKTWLRYVLMGSIIGIVLGIAALISCIGLWKLKEWGKYLWLFISITIFFYNAYSTAINDAMFTNSEVLKLGLYDWIPTILFGVLTSISWIYLTWSKTANIFRAT